MKKFISILLCILSVTFIIPAVNAETSDTVKGMTLEEKIGQMITVDIPTWNNKSFTKINNDITQFIKDTGVGGVTLFGDNFKSTEQALKLTTDLQKASEIPLMISTDQEGGSVVRLNTGTSLPGNMALGAIGDEKDARAAGNIIGSELSALGINTVFAPSLDVNSNPKNPVIGIRSFSSDPEIVKNMGNAYIQGIMDNYVVPTIKHFPGHGDTNQDSHEELPSVNKNLDDLLNCDLIPFLSSIPMGVDMVMTAHIQFPNVDNTTVKNKSGEEITVPATLSKKFITDILRNQIGFNGVVTTDSLSMDAIRENFDTADACIKAINAGCDNLLMPVSITNKNSVKEFKSLIKDIANAVKKGTIKEERIDESVTRILDLKEKYGILSYSAPKTSNALSVVGSEEHHKTELEIAEKAVTVLKNQGNVLPFKTKSNSKVVLVSAYENEIPLFDYSMKKLGITNYDTFCYNRDKKTSVLNAVKSADFTVVLSEMNMQQDLDSSSTTTTMTRSVMNTAKMYKKKCAVVSVSLPYDTANFTDAEALMCCYGCNGMEESDANLDTPEYTYGPNIIASLNVIFGKANPQGKLPVDIPSIKDNKMNTENLAFKLGFGIDLSEKQPEPTTVSSTEKATEETTVATTVTEQTSAPATKVAESDFEKNIYGYIFVGVAGLVVILTVIYIILCIKSSKNKKKNRRRH